MSGPILTTGGLRTSPAGAGSLPNIQWAAAAGSADVIQAVYQTTVTALYDGLILGVRAAYANATTAPVFAPDGISALTIVKLANVALEPGDIAGNYAEILLRYNAGLNKWVLLNPTAHFRDPAAEWALSSGSADALVATYIPAHGSLIEGELVRVRANHANATTAPTLAVDGFPARIIYRFGQQALVANNIVINQDLLLIYHADATPWFELLNPATTIAGGSWAIATGTVDVITATYTPANTAFTDGMELDFRATGINLTTTPTFNPDGLGALIIYRGGKLPLFVNDIAQTGEYKLRYHTGTPAWWELMNPNGGVQTYTLPTDDTSATDVATALGWFPGADDTVLVGNGSEYEFEGYLQLSRAAGTTSHTTATLFGGTATFDHFVYEAEANVGDVLTILGIDGAYSVANPPTTPNVCKAASTSATEQTMLHVKGRFKVAAAGNGSVVPQFILSAAAGGISTRKAGSWFTIKPATTQGTWA